MNRIITSNLISELLKQRYLLKDDHGRIVENVNEMYKRISHAVAGGESGGLFYPTNAETMAEKFYRMLEEGLFFPNSPTLMNAGRENGLLSSCFVLGIEDSIEGIFDTVKNSALIQKAGGGTGFSFDSLRPTGEIVSSSGGVTSGPISFWRVFAEASRAVQQGSRRRGANMGMMSIDHPDVLNFISAKNDLDAFSNFNISVKITDAFMEELKTQPESPHRVINPRTSDVYYLPRALNVGRYGLHDLLPLGHNPDSCYTVRDVWDLIVSNAHATGEPGVCFIDCVNKENPTPQLGAIKALNPCGEQPLLSGEACCLGSIDISKFIIEEEREVCWDRLDNVVTGGIQFLDKTLDANSYPVEEIKKVTLGNRKIGLGIMGLADALVFMGIRYDSEEAIDFARKLSWFVQKTALKASEDLAGEYGCFPNWNGSIWDTKHHRPMRNATCTTIAPTGSISILAGCSSGIEPIYSLAYCRRALNGKRFIYLHPLLERRGESGGWLTDSVRRELLEGVSACHIREIPKQLSDVLVTAHEIAPEWHVRMQAAFQEHVDNAVSKTVNLPADAPIEAVDKIFHLAFELNCKGITVYRDHCRKDQTFSEVCEDLQPAGAQTCSVCG